MAVKCVPKYDDVSGPYVTMTVHDIHSEKILNFWLF